MLGWWGEEGGGVTGTFGEDLRWGWPQPGEKGDVVVCDLYGSGGTDEQTSRRASGQLCLNVNSSSRRGERLTLR